MGVKNIPGLFARNERVITYIQSDFGEIALVKVGATNVGSIKVEFDDKVSTNPYPAKPIFHKVYEEFHPLKKGAELGRFEFGSTIILLFEPVKIEWISSLQPGTSVKMGQSLARVLRTKGE
jgi:phosphatidylserine decarboxylase